MYKRWETINPRRSLRHYFVMLGRAKPWQLLLIMIIFGFVAATFLRLNNLGMVERRQAVIEADKTGGAELIRTKLIDLQHWASAHMNAEPGAVYLKQSYNRDYEAAVAAGASERNPNSDVYQQASVACRERFQGGTASFQNDYVACVAAAVSSLPPEQQKTVSLPHPNSYRYSFSSPLISLDFAGVSFIAASFLLACIFGKITGVMILKLLLRRRAKVF